MTPADVKALVEREIDGRWDVMNAHGCTCRENCIEPRKVKIHAGPNAILGFGPAWIDVWIVLEEAVGSPYGYKVVYDEERDDFGLGVGMVGTNFPGVPSDYIDYLGPYGGRFWGAFEMM